MSTDHPYLCRHTLAWKEGELIKDWRKDILILSTKVKGVGMIVEVIGT